MSFSYSYSTSGPSVSSSTSDDRGDALRKKKLATARHSQRAGSLLPNAACCANNPELKVCRAELDRLRNEQWREHERKAIMEERRHQDWIDSKYRGRLEQWQKCQQKLLADCDRRKKLMLQLQCQREELAKAKEETRRWRQYQTLMLTKQKEKEQRMLIKEYYQREQDRRFKEEQVRAKLDEKWLEAQTKQHTAAEHARLRVPELTELRGMFLPVHCGPNLTYECMVMEPQPNAVDAEKEEVAKVVAMEDLRDAHGIHLNISDKLKKRTTITVAMGPRNLRGENRQIFKQPGAACPKPRDCIRDPPALPKVPLPECLEPIMKTLSYRVKKMNSPLLRMEPFGDEQIKKPPGPGPHFNGARLYGTLVIPNGPTLSPYYTDPCCVTF